VTEKLCRDCNGPIRWSSEQSLRVLCDLCWDARGWRQISRAAKAMTRVLKDAEPDIAPEELFARMADAQKRSLKEDSE
jgi:hypothetical protein